MPVTYDAAPSGYSGSAPSTLPFTLAWEHASTAVLADQPGISVWVVLHKAGVDIVTGSTRSATCGGIAMQSQGSIALAANSLLVENFVLVGQPIGAPRIEYTYGNDRGVKPYVLRADSESFKGTLGFGEMQFKAATTANGSLAAISAAGEMLSCCHVARSANISNTSGTDRFIKNNVTPRVAITDQAGADNVTVSMTNNATDWAIGATRVLPGAAEPPPPPPPTPSLPAVVANPLGGVMIALPGTYVPSPDITVSPMADTAPAYSNPVMFAWDTAAARFRIGGTLTLSDHNGMQCGVNNVSGQSIDTNPLTAGLTSFETEFWLIGGDCTIKFRSFANTDYLILVDDKPVTTGWQNFGTVGYRYQRIVIDDDQPHRVRVLHGYNGFCGVLVPGGGDIQPAGARPRLAITGDSYVQGAGSASEPGPVGAGGICGYLSLFMGYEVWNLGQGTTGYKDPGVSGGRSAFGSTARLANLNARSYDAIVIFGGGNDSSETPSDVVNNYAIPMWNAVKAAHATTPLIVIGIQSPDLFPAAQMTALNTALATAALASTSVDLWIDMRNPQYWVDDTTEPLFITPEFPASIHPGKAGSLNIAQRIMLALARAFLAG